jgi:MFS family permease
VNNLNDGMSWRIYPLFFASFGLGVASIGTIKAVYPATWGIFQLVTGHFSDHWGRKRLIAAGMIVQAGGIWLGTSPRVLRVDRGGLSSGTWHSHGLPDVASGDQ